MRNIDIDQTFAAIRQLPPEVELKSIELFVQRQPKRQVQSGNGHKWMKVSKLLLAAALLAGGISAGISSANAQDFKSKLVQPGTIVVGNHVSVEPVAVTHGSMTVVVTENPQVSQPGPFGGLGRTVVTPQSAVQILSLIHI